MYKICATKRDLDIIDRKLYRFIPDLWEVNVASKGIYQLKYEDGQYNLYSNGEQTTLFIPNISLIRGCVYEGQQVTVELTDDSLKRYIGTLIQINQDGEKAISKSVVFSDSQCSLKSPSQEYADNRLVREEDIIRPEQVSVYYDPRYLSIEHVKTNGIEILPLQFIPEYIERLPGDNMSSEVQKTQACKAVTCSKGDRVVVTKKEGVEYDIVITKVTDYSSLETILLNHDDVLEFDVNQTVFIEFQIPIETYTLYAHCGEIHTETASLTVNATVDGKTAQLVRGACDSSGNYSVTTSQIQVKPGQIVQIEVEADCEIGSPSVYSPSIRNLITNLEIEPITISSDSQTWTGSFIMPKADCLLSPKVKYILHDGGQEDINPLFYLTVKSSDLASVVVNNTEYDLTNGPVTMLCDVADVSWELLDGYLSKVDIYSTQNPSAVFHSEVGFITHKAYVLSCDTTIEISLQQVDCKYKSFRGKIDSLDKGKKWNSSNSILNVSGNVPQKTYYVDTNVQIGDSGEPSHFEGTEVEEVVFYNPANSFYIHPKAFKKCKHLKSIDLSKSSNIRVKEEAFWGSFSLSDFKNTQAISELGEYSFTNTDLPSFTYGHDLLQIPDYTFMNCRDLADVDYESSSSLESVGKLAFDNCRKLKHAVFPKSLSKIGDQCFGENAFRSIHTNPAYEVRTLDNTESCIFNVDSIQYQNGMTIIPQYAFEFCKNIEEIHLPHSITLIDKGAFLACQNISHFTSPGLKVVHEKAFGDTWIEGIESDKLESTASIVSNHSMAHKLYKVPSTTGIYFDKTAASLGGLTPNHTVCTYISPKTDNSVLILYKCNEHQKGGIGVGRYMHPIHPNTISISPYAFSGNYDFGNIGYYADARWDESDVPIDGKLEYIGRAAFYDNQRLMTFRFPNKGTTSFLGDHAFYGCKRLSEVLNFKQQPITRIEDYTFYNCGDNKYGIGGATDAGYNNLDFYIPNTVTSIGKYAFAKCPQLMSIANLATCNITSIDEGAFEGCFQNSTWIASTNKQIAIFTTALVCAVACIVVGGVEAGGYFANNAIGQLTWYPHTFETGVFVEHVIAGVEAGAAAGVYGGTNGASSWSALRNKTAEVFLPKTISIGKNTFKDCTHLGSITFNYKMNEIPDQAFYNCQRLHTVLFAQDSFRVDSQETHQMVYPNITTIGEGAFYNCNLDSLAVSTLLYNAVTVKKNAFKGCQAAAKGLVIIPKSVQTLEEGSLAFGGDCMYAFLSEVPPANVSSNAISGDSYIHVKFGSRSAYQQKFPHISSSRIIEHAANDEVWTILKTKQGYEI